MANEPFFVLFISIMLEIYSINETQYKVTSIETSEINLIIIVIIKINNTYLSKWCTAITNKYPVPV